jgi:hypothetical protein
VPIACDVRYTRHHHRPENDETSGHPMPLPTRAPIAILLQSFYGRKINTSVFIDGLHPRDSHAYRTAGSDGNRNPGSARSRATAARNFLRSRCSSITAVCTVLFGSRWALRLSRNSRIGRGSPFLSKRRGDARGGDARRRPPVPIILEDRASPALMREAGKVESLVPTLIRRCVRGRPRAVAARDACLRGSPGVWAGRDGKRGFGLLGKVARGVDFFCRLMQTLGSVTFRLWRRRWAWCAWWGRS